MTVPLNARQKLRANLGLDHTANLAGWAQLIHGAFPTSRVFVFGSVLQGKDFRDVDVSITFPQEDYDRMTLGKVRADVLGGAFDVLAAAFSALATQMVGVRVEVRVLPHNNGSGETLQLAGDAA